MRKKIMKKIINKYEPHYLITLVLIFLILLFSILPILPYSVYIGLEDRRIPIYKTQVHVYYAYFFDLIENGNVLSFIYAFGMIAFYVSSFIASIYILLGDKRNTKIWLVILSLSHILGIITFSYISIFSTISICFTLSIYIIDLVIDKRMMKLNSHDQELLINMGKAIREKRIDMNLTQQQLADKVYVSRSLIAKIETGSYVPNERLINDLSDILDIDLKPIILE